MKMNRSILAACLFTLGASSAYAINIGTGSVTVDGTVTLSTCEMNIVDPGHTMSFDGTQVGPNTAGNMLSSFSFPIAFSGCPGQTMHVALTATDGVLSSDIADGRLAEPNGLSHLKFQVEPSAYTRVKMEEPGTSILIPTGTPLALDGSLYTVRVDPNSNIANLAMDVKIYSTGLQAAAHSGNIEGSFTYTFSHI